MLISPQYISISLIVPTIYLLYITLCICIVQLHSIYRILGTIEEKTYNFSIEYSRKILLYSHIDYCVVLGSIYVLHCFPKKFFYMFGFNKVYYTSIILWIIPLARYTVKCKTKITYWQCFI